MAHLAYIDTETTGLDIDKHPIWELALIIEGHENSQFDGEWVFQFPVSMDSASPEALKMTNFINRYECWDKQPRVVAYPTDKFYTQEDIFELAIKFSEETGKRLVDSQMTTSSHFFPDPVDRLLWDYCLKDYKGGKQLLSDFVSYSTVTTLSSLSILKFVITLTNGAHLVGAVPDFDAYRLSKMMSTYDLRPTWHYHLIDVENLAVGYLQARASAWSGESYTGEEITLPWKSDHISKELNVTPPQGEDRHTALADARWAREIYKKVMT